jgi:hypothetical protein
LTKQVLVFMDTVAYRARLFGVRKLACAF